MITVGRYFDLKNQVIKAGYERDVIWAENVLPVDLPCKLVAEYIWVVLNSGMRNQVAEVIAQRVTAAQRRGEPVSSVFGHRGKAAAIERAVVEGVMWFDRYRACESDAERLAYLESLPWIGRITKWHLAKNLGLDVMKPDRHLVRIAGDADAAREMCERLAEQTGERVATVDYVIWRAANLGLM